VRACKKEQEAELPVEVEREAESHKLPILLVQMLQAVSEDKQ